MHKYKEFLSYDTEEIQGEFISGEAIHTIEEARAREGERLADYSFVSRLIDVLAGRSLTLIESVLTDKNQQRAAKETLKALVSDVRDKAHREIYLGQ
jgi:hypothetical protein